MIWDLAIGTDSILLYPCGFPKGSQVFLQDVKGAESVMVTRKHILNEHCAGLQWSKGLNIPSIQEGKRTFLIIIVVVVVVFNKGMPLPKDPEPVFSWLVTNKQIYTEAKPLIEGVRQSNP
ncbi:hypothetical protein DPV78_008781 [Talaromyces pinophilus]|nr:hypothetical protein DPV78_008781 [Talaromyces pinophilus]